MARYEPEVIVTQSVLDRLLDDDPSVSLDPPMTRAQSFRQFKASLRRDLEWLLNSRRTPEPVPDEVENASRSVINYGLPDLSTLNITFSGDRGRIVQMLETTVNRFEPRIANARVVMEPAVPAVRAIRFRIEGLMRIDPAPEHVSFDTLLELTSGEYEVK